MTLLQSNARAEARAGYREGVLDRPLYQKILDVALYPLRHKRKAALIGTAAAVLTAGFGADYLATSPRTIESYRAKWERRAEDIKGIAPWFNGNAPVDGQPTLQPYPTPTATAVPTRTPEPTREPTATPKPTEKPTPVPLVRYLQSDDGLASVECFSESGCAPEDLQKYLDHVYPLATDGKPVSAIISDRYKWVDGQLVKQDGKSLLLVSEADYDTLHKGGEVRLEWENGNNAATLKSLTEQFGDVYKSVADKLKPSEKPAIYLTVSPDGKKFNVTVYNEFLNDVRHSMTSFYPWNIMDDSGQMRYEMGVAFDRELNYFMGSGDAFLTEFVGAIASNDVKDWYSKIRLEELKTGKAYTKPDDFGQVQLGADIFIILKSVRSDAEIAELFQKLEGREVKWEQFKVESGVDELKYVDTGVNLWRASRK